MLITLSHRTAICQSVAEVYGVAPLGAVSHIFNFLILFLLFGSIQLRNVYPFPKSKMSIFCHIFSMFLFLMKSATWFFHDFCGLRLLPLPCGVHWQIFSGQRLSSILIRIPYHFTCLLLFK